MYNIKEDNKIKVAATTLIEAKPSEVWAVLADIENWQKWTPFIASFEGDFELNGKIKVTFNTPDGLVPFDRSLVIFEENRVFCWEGDAPFPNSKDHHVFYLEEDENGNTLLTQADGFHGMERTEDVTNMEEQSKGLYAMMNEQLKAFIEG
ncbi:MAG: SRPBCC domain-containing protein [Saprospiraceae bacterium]